MLISIVLRDIQFYDYIFMMVGQGMYITRMHSSRMPTICNSSHLLGGGLLSWPFVVVIFCYALLVWWPSG